MADVLYRFRVIDPTSEPVVGAFVDVSYIDPTSRIRTMRGARTMDDGTVFFRIDASVTGTATVRITPRAGSVYRPVRLTGARFVNNPRIASGPYIEPSVVMIGYNPDAIVTRRGVYMPNQIKWLMMKVDPTLAPTTGNTYGAFASQSLPPDPSSRRNLWSSYDPTTFPSLTAYFLSVSDPISNPFLP